MFASTKSRPSRGGAPRPEREPIVPVDPCVKIEPGSSSLHRQPEVPLHRRERRLEPLRRRRPGAGACPRSGGIASTRRRQPRSPIGSGNGNADGSPGTGPASIDSNSRTSAMDVANGPNVERSIHSGIGSRPITPFVGLKPASPQNAAGIRMEPPPSVAVAIGGHAGRERGRRAAARPARRPVGSPGVRRRSVERVRREPGERELRLVRLAHDDRAGRPQPARHQSVGGRRGSVGERPGTVRRRHARHVFHVLHQQREAGERTGILAVLDPLVHRPGVVQRAFSQPDHRVERRIQPLDPFERHPDQVGRRRAAGSDGGRELRQRHRSVTRSRTRTIVRPRLRSLRTTVDAFRPGTPITPPPGCVPPPQR